MQEFILPEGRRICICGDLNAPVCVVQPVDGREISSAELQMRLIDKLCPGMEFSMLAVEIMDWGAELTPWSAENIPGRTGFSGGAEPFLRELEMRILPEFEQKAGIPRKMILAGYSLAGLFALWTAYRSSRFDAAAAVSPSVWYPGWLEFAQGGKPMANAVYLSLGEKEEKTRHPLMSQVGQAIREQYALLQQAGIPCALEWNPGNHFQNVERRMAAGIAWTLHACAE